MNAERNGKRLATQRGREFEKWVEKLLDRAVSQGILKRWDRQHPEMVPARVPGVRPMFVMGKSSGVDWIALASPSQPFPPYWAIEAKAVEGNSLGSSNIAPHQIAALNETVEAGQGGLLMVKFVTEDGWGEEYAVPWKYAPWRKNGNGLGLHQEDVIRWRVTGVDSLKEAMSWRI